MTMKTRDQEFAEKAYKAVSERINTPGTDQKEYRSFAKRFPTLIHTCGLMQAVVFAQAKGGMQEAVLNDFINIQGEKKDKFLCGCREDDMQKYMLISRIAMIAAGWLKRQADALIEGEDDNG